jgi:hypothetical protein
MLTPRHKHMLAKTWVWKKSRKQRAYESYAFMLQIGCSLHENISSILIYIERILLLWLENMLNVCNFRKRGLYFT